MSSKIVIFADYYLPGYKAGGPVQSLSGLVSLLKTHYEVILITRNHDFGETTPYSLKPNHPINQEGVTVYYLSRDRQNFFYYKSLLTELKPDRVYLNSFFSFRFSILPLLTVKLSSLHSSILLATRGEFSPGALAIKAWKKKAYINLFQWLYKKICFHVTNQEEAKYVQSYFPRAKTKVAGNIFHSEYLEQEKISVKKPGELKVIFLSRISRKKNLKGILQLLTAYPVGIQLDIYGPLEDESYWEECKSLINKLPQQVEINYCGVVEQPQVGKIFSEYDLFLFLTHGENFGHVILEALASGCPVILSQQTPWHDLQSFGAGWCFQRNDFKAISHALQKLIELDSKQYQQLIDNAKAYVKRYTASPEVKSASLELFKP